MVIIDVSVSTCRTHRRYFIIYRVFFAFPAQWKILKIISIVILPAACLFGAKSSLLCFIIIRKKKPTPGEVFYNSYCFLTIQFSFIYRGITLRYHRHVVWIFFLHIYCHHIPVLPPEFLTTQSIPTSRDGKICSFD